MLKDSRGIVDINRKEKEVRKGVERRRERRINIGEYRDMVRDNRGEWI